MTGSIVTFDDAIPFMPIESIVAQITPVQDLHGQDAPYPPGGGKNKQQLIQPSGGRGISFALNDDGSLHISGTATADATFYINGSSYAGNDTPELSAGTYTMFCNNFPTNGSATTRVTFNGKYANGNNPSSSTLLARADGTKNTLTFTATDVYKSALYLFISSGETVNFDLEIQLESGSSATAYAPYSNECPISGWTGAEIEQAGINLFDKSTVTHGYKILGTGQVYPDSNMAYTDYIPVRQGMTLYCSPNWYVGLNVIFFYDSGKQMIGKNANNTHIYITPDNCRYIRINMLETEVDTATVNYPSTDTSYHAYSGSSLSINWQDTAGTVYGGTMTVNEDGSGELSANMASVDLGTLTWGKNTDSFGINFYSNSLQNIIKPSTGGAYLQNILCSNYESLSWANYATSASDMCTAQVQKQIRIKDSSLESLDYTDFKSAMSGVQLAYELAEPQIYHFDNLEQLTTLIGTNNVWVDTGDVTVTYQSTTSRSEYIVGMIGRPIEVFDENTELPENTSDVLEKTIDVFDEHEVEKIDNPLLKNTIELYDPKEIDESEKPEDTFNDTVDIFD